MSETQTVETSETDTDTTEPTTHDGGFEQYPADHPLVKRLEAMKAELKEVKPKAKRLDQLEEATKTEAQKNAERIAAAEAVVATVPAQVAESLKAHLVTLHEIDSEDAELFLTATEPELLLKQVSRLLSQTDKRRTKNHVPKEGTNPTAAPTDDLRQFTTQLFAGE